MKRVRTTHTFSDLDVLYELYPSSLQPLHFASLGYHKTLCHTGREQLERFKFRIQTISESISAVH